MRRLRQLVVTFSEAGKAHWKANTFFRRLEDNEGRRLAGAQLFDEFVIHDDFSDASIRKAAHETGSSNIGLIDLEAKA